MPDPLFLVQVLIKFRLCSGNLITFEKRKDFDTKRQFLLDYIDRVEYWDEDVSIHGSIPLQVKSGDGEEQKKIEFKISGKITTADRFNKYAKYGTGIRTITLPQYNGFSK